jgi:hypothetical protein
MRHPRPVPPVRFRELPETLRGGIHPNWVEEGDRQKSYKETCRAALEQSLLEPFAVTLPFPKSGYVSREMFKEEALVRTKAEDPFLVYLDEFGQEKKVHDSVVAEFKKTKKALTRQSLNLLERGSDQSAYLRLLDERAEQAKQLLAEPVDALERERSLVNQLEREIEEIELKMPAEMTAAAFKELSERRKQTDVIEAANILKAKELDYRRMMVGLREKEIEARVIGLDALKKHAQDDQIEKVSAAELSDGTEAKMKLNKGNR